MYRIWRFDQEKGYLLLKRCGSYSSQDRARVLEAKEKTIQAKVDQEVDFRIVLPDGSLRYVRMLVILQRLFPGMSLKRLVQSWTSRQQEATQH